MSRFLAKRHEGLIPYTPGEQPQSRKLIKLNTNELPFPPSPLAQKLAREEAGNLNLYSDPECFLLRQTAAEYLAIDKDEIMFGNGSDDILNYIFDAYCERPMVFPDVTYSFYPVIADLHHVAYREIPVEEDFTVDPQDYYEAGATVLLANPNAPSGIPLPLSSIEEIVRRNPEDLVIIDEAYIDFGGESAVPLIRRYGNLLVVRTFSKAGALAGARLGYAVGCKDLINDLNVLRNSLNPYCVNRMTMMAGVGALCDRSYLDLCVKKIRGIREKTAVRLKELGFTVTPSVTNFLFARHPEYDGRQLYLDLKEKGILIRHFETPRTHDWIRISIGSAEEMQILTDTIRELLEVRG